MLVETHKKKFGRQLTGISKNTLGALTTTLFLRYFDVVLQQKQTGDVYFQRWNMVYEIDNVM